MATQTVQAADHKLLVAGEWIETGEWGEVRSPYDGTVVGRVAEGDAALVDRAAEAAQEAFEARRLPPARARRGARPRRRTWSASGSTTSP